MDANGQNFFTVTAINGQFMTAIALAGARVDAASGHGAGGSGVTAETASRIGRRSRSCTQGAARPSAVALLKAQRLSASYRIGWPSVRVGPPASVTSTDVWVVRPPDRPPADGSAFD